MTWWEAVLWTLGIIAFWPTLLFVGDKVNHWFQDRQTLTLKQHSTHKRKGPKE